MLNWLLLFPFIAAAVIAAFPRIVRLLPAHERGSAFAAPAATAVTTVALSLAICAAAGGTVLRANGAFADYLWTPDFFQFRLRLDALGLYCLLAILGALLLTALWATGAGVRDHVRWAGFAATAGAFTGIVLAADLVLLYMCWELSALTLWVALSPQPTSGKRYLTWNYGGGLCILIAILLVAGFSSDTHIYTAGAGLLIKRLSVLKWLGVVLVLGLAVKLALVPAHVWLRRLVHSGRGAWDIALLGIALLVAGYGAMRLVFYLLPGYVAQNVAWVPICLGGVTAVGAGVGALLAREVRASASYVLAAAAGQIALAIGVGMRGQADGLSGAMALIAALALAALLLGAGIGADSGTLTWRDMRGRFRVAPARGAALLAGAWTLAGLPPLAGFWGQRALITASWEVAPVLGLLALLAPVFILAYGVRAAATGFAGMPPTADHERAWQRWWTLGTILASLVLGSAPHLWVPYVLDIARSLTGG